MLPYRLRPLVGVEPCPWSGGGRKSYADTRQVDRFGLVAVDSSLASTETSPRSTSNVGAVARVPRGFFRRPGRGAVCPSGGSLFPEGRPISVTVKGLVTDYSRGERTTSTTGARQNVDPMARMNPDFGR